jgi:hypothetical protein
MKDQLMKDQHQAVPAPDADAPATSRRTLMKATMALGAMGMLGYFPIRSVLAVGDAAPALPATAVAFQKMSQFLTSKPLNAVLAQRYYDALKKRDPDLDKSVAALNTLVDQHKLAHMDEYLALSDVDKDLDTRAKTIVKSLYLGVVGDDENAELIAYKDAFMYAPTQDVLVVPTYAFGPATWGLKPDDKKVQG